MYTRTSIGKENNVIEVVSFKNSKVSFKRDNALKMKLRETTHTKKLVQH